MSLLHFRPVPLFIPEEVPYKIYQFIQKCYDNRLNASLSTIHEADIYLSQLDGGGILYTYFKDLVYQLHQEYDIQDKSIIAFLVYYIKTPLLIIDDPMLIQPGQLIRGLDKKFISSFIKLSIEDRLNFILSLNLDVNSWFVKNGKLPVLDYSLVDKCNSYKTGGDNELELQYNFSSYYDVTNNILLPNDKHVVPKEIINEMVLGKYDIVTNIRVNQLKLLKTLYIKEKYVEFTDDIEEYTLNSIHDITSIQKAVTINPFDYILPKNIKKSIIKRHDTYNKNDNKILFLENESHNYIVDIQLLYKKYKVDIHKIINIIYKKNNIGEFNSKLESYILKNDLPQQIITFFELFYKCFSEDLSYLPKTMKGDLYSKYISDISIQDILPSNLFETDPVYIKIQPYFSEIHYNIRSEYPNYESLE